MTYYSDASTIHNLSKAHICFGRRMFPKGKNVAFRWFLVAEPLTYCFEWPFTLFVDWFFLVCFSKPFQHHFHLENVSARISTLIHCEWPANVCVCVVFSTANDPNTHRTLKMPCCYGIVSSMQRFIIVFQMPIK